MRFGLRHPRGVISASKNSFAVLAAAGVENLFDVRVDGVVMEDLGLLANRIQRSFSRRHAGSTCAPTARSS